MGGGGGQISTAPAAPLPFYGDFTCKVPKCWIVRSTARSRCIYPWAATKTTAHPIILHPVYTLISAYLLRCITLAGSCDVKSSYHNNFEGTMYYDLTVGAGGRGGLKAAAPAAPTAIIS